MSLQGLEEVMDDPFKKQFDRSASEFHRGDPTPVPVGGARLPSELEKAGASLDWQSLPEQPSAPAPSPADFGPEYEAVHNLRETLGNLKKALSAVTQPIGASIQLRNSASPAPEAIAEADVKRAQAVESLRAFLAHFPEGEESEPKRALIERIAAKAMSDLSESEYRDFVIETQQEGSKLFNEQKKLLEKMKAIKKTQAAK